MLTPNDYRTFGFNIFRGAMLFIGLIWTMSALSSDMPYWSSLFPFMVAIFMSSIGRKTDKCLRRQKACLNVIGLPFAIGAFIAYFGWGMQHGEEPLIALASGAVIGLCAFASFGVAYRGVNKSLEKHQANPL